MILRKFKSLVAVFAVCALATGCTSTFDSLNKQMLVSTGVGALSGYAGHEFSDGNAAVTTMAAAGGFLASELIGAEIEKEQERVFETGYNMGRSDSAKTQYWMNQRRQQNEEGNGQNKTVVHRYMFPAPTRVGNVKYVPYDYDVRITE